jgi:hypothetical protein
VPVAHEAEAGPEPEPDVPPAASAKVVAPRAERPETATRTAVAPRGAPARSRKGRVFAGAAAIAVVAALVAVVALRGGEPGRGLHALPSPRPSAQPERTAGSTGDAGQGGEGEPALAIPAAAAPPASPSPTNRSSSPIAATSRATTPSTSIAAPPATPPPVATTSTVRRAEIIAAAARRADCPNQFTGVEAPPAESGQGLLAVNTTTSWAELTVDGRPVGYTPCTLQLPAGRYRLRVFNKTLGAAQTAVVIKPGERAAWFPKTLSR